MKEYRWIKDNVTNIIVMIEYNRMRALISDDLPYKICCNERSHKKYGELITNLKNPEWKPILTKNRSNRLATAKKKNY